MWVRPWAQCLLPCHRLHPGLFLAVEALRKGQVQRGMALASTLCRQAEGLSQGLSPD